MDFFDSAVFCQGVLANDTVHTQNPYLFDKGFLLNKLDIRYRLLDDKLTLGTAVVLNSLAQEVEWTGVSSVRDPVEGHLLPTAPSKARDLGLEVQLMAQYRFNKSLQCGLLAASLVAPGKAWDFFEVGIERNGTPDQDFTTIQSNLAFLF